MRSHYLEQASTLDFKDAAARELVLRHFPVSGIFLTERHFLLFKDQLAESGRQKTKENIIPRGKFRLVENDTDFCLFLVANITRYHL